MTSSSRTWHDVAPEEAASLTPEQITELHPPRNEMGEPCPWPWEPQQLVGAPLGQYHCPYCGAMVLAGVPHLDYSETGEGAWMEVMELIGVYFASWLNDQPPESHAALKRQASKGLRMDKKERNLLLGGR